MGSIVLKGVREDVRRRRRHPGRRSRHRRRRVRRLRRPVGLRQVDAAAPDRRARGRDRRADPDRRRRCHDLPPAKRGLSMVFQSYALYPHMSVRDNIGFGAQDGGQPKAEIDAEGRGGRGDAQPDALSRPQAARSSPAASASASRSAAPSCASRRPSCSTSRCPTSTRRCACRCGSRSRGCTKTLGTTAIYVTHDQVEAMTMADKIVVLNAGQGRAGRLAARTLRTSGQSLRRRLHRLAEDELRIEAATSPGNTARRPSASGPSTS